MHFRFEISYHPHIAWFAEGPPRGPLAGMHESESVLRVGTIPSRARQQADV